MTLTLSKVLMLVACALFVVAALITWGAITGLAAWGFGFLALAAWALALVV